VVAATLIATLLAAAPPAVRAAAGERDGMTAVGQCRAGQPQGHYALRDASGRLRVQGAFSQGQRVGSFIFWSADGSRLAHLPFDADRLNGTLSMWHPAANDAEPPRRLEASYRAGVRHGTTRAWDPDGRLREAAEYADGALVSVRAYDERGEAMADAPARREAQAARAAEDREIEALLATVRLHRLDCAPPPVRQQAGAPDIRRATPSHAALPGAPA
jgi:hypothetical protein